MKLLFSDDFLRLSVPLYFRLQMKFAICMFKKIFPYTDIKQRERSLFLEPELESIFKFSIFILKFVVCIFPRLSVILFLLQSVRILFRYYCNIRFILQKSEALVEIAMSSHTQETLLMHHNRWNITMVEYEHDSRKTITLAVLLLHKE